MDENTVRAVYRFLNHQGRGFTEIRAIDPKGTPPVRAWVSSEEDFVKTCCEWDGKRNIYVGINPRARKGGTREDVDQVVAVVLDIDAARPDKKQAATEGELKNAEHTADRIIADFKARGFIQSVKCCSGNGWQLWFAIPPINAAVLGRELVEGKLQEFQKRVKAKYEDKRVTIDNIGDLPRVIKVIGTMNIKGEPTPERPHRLSFAQGDFVRREDALLRDYILSLELPQPPKFIAQPVKLSNEKVLEIIKHSPEIRRYYERGDIDRSKADFAITCWLAKHSIPAEQIRDVLLSTSWSKIHDAKKVGDSERYFRLTYEHALAAVQDEIKAQKNTKKRVKAVGRKATPKVVESLEVPDLIDIVLTKNGQPAYLLGSEPRLEDQVLAEDVVMIPPKTRWMAPTERALDHVKEEDYDLFQDVKDYIHAHVDLPDDRQYAVVTAWIFATWVYDELFDSLPFLLALGPYASGKTRVLEVIQRLCWRPIFTSALTEANVFRPTEIIKPTLLIDETDLTGRSDRANNVTALLRARHKRGVDIMRSNPEKSGFESLEFFRCYGPTAIASVRDLEPALRSRCLVIGMLEKTRAVRKRIDEQAAQELRNRLLAFRIRHMDDLKDEPHDELDFLESGRLNELFSPLVRIAKICERPLAPSEEIKEVGQAMTFSLDDIKPWQLRVRRGRHVFIRKPIIRKAIVGRTSKSPIVLPPRGRRRG